jgi:hypothetical protein
MEDFNKTKFQASTGRRTTGEGNLDWGDQTDQMVPFIQEHVPVCKVIQNMSVIFSDLFYDSAQKIREAC